MCIAVAIPEFYGGGGTRVLEGIVEALNRLGIVPAIISGYPASLEDARRVLAQKELLFRYVHLKTGGRGLYKKVSFNRSLKVLLKDYQGVVYINPILACLPDEVPSLAYLFFPELDFRYKPLLSRMARKAYYLPLWLFKQEHSKKNNVVFLTLSKYAAATFQRINKISPFVIYPPVNLIHRVYKNEKKMILSLARFEPEKNQLEQIYIAAHFPDVEFVIAGQASTRRSQKYFEKCERLVRKLRLRNVTLMKNISRSSVIELLAMAKVLLHSARGEHFGISVVEGMSAGCIPVVHDSGGPAEIVDVESLRYRTFEESILAIQRALQMSDHEVLRFRSRAESFSKDSFVQEISQHLVKLVST